MNRSIPCNNDWLFMPEYSEAIHTPGGGAGLVSVRIPHTVSELPFSYVNEQDYQLVCGYRRELFVPAEWRGSRLLLRFGAVAHCCEVFVNGKLAGAHNCGYTAFAVEIADFVEYGAENVVALKVDARECRDVPPFGGVMDYLAYGGVYREVWLEVKPPVLIADVFAMAGEENSAAALDCEISLDGQAEGLKIAAVVRDGETEVWRGEAVAEGDVFRIKSAVQGARLWEIDDPKLYDLRISLLQNGLAVDEQTVRVGFRGVVWRADGFYLNGKKVKLRGLNRHQSWPYVGYAMPRRAQRLDADILKTELGLNAVRTSHYPQSPHFIDRCDEIGLLVFTEIPGWNYIGGADWQEQAVQNTRDMVAQYRNHPSVVLWGVRVNESADDDELYRRTNEAARQLDKTRQTGGVRNFKKSSFLEDVYTYNDFKFNGRGRALEPQKRVTPDINKAYIVTEYMGHMFPAKTYDNNLWRQEHALRHAKVLSAAARTDGLAGSFGWCFADYNTHGEFGGGDKICHHGVLDLFRNPKPAAAAYASQSDGRAVLEVGGMEPGDNPSMYLGGVYAFTNADSVELFKNGEPVGVFFPDEKRYGGLKHPPVRVDDLMGKRMEQKEGYGPKKAKRVKRALKAIIRWGEGGLPLPELLNIAGLMAFGGLKRADFQRLAETYMMHWEGARWRFEAARNGEVVKTVVKEPVERVRLDVSVDTNELCDGETYDVATVRLFAVDQNGNALPYCMEAVRLSLEGPAELIGPDVVPLRGGMGGTYVRTTGGAGRAVLVLDAEGMETVRVEFLIRNKN